MKYLKKIQNDAEALFINHDVLYLSLQSNNIFIKKFYEEPSIEIVMKDEYHDTSLIDLKAKKMGVNDTIVWSTNLASDVATIDGTVLRFLKHYEGEVTITATAGEYSDIKAISISCNVIPTEYVYTIYEQPSVPTVDADSTSTELSFKGQVTAKYDGHKEDETTISTYTFTPTFPSNVSTMNVNTEYVDMGLSVMWAKCNLGATQSNNIGRYFQWAEIDGFNKANTTQVRQRSGTYKWQGQDISWKVMQRYDDGKIFIPQTNKYYDTETHRYTKYDGDKRTLDNGDDAAARWMGNDVTTGEMWRIPRTGEFQELINNTTHSIGLYGILILTSNINGNSIEIPLAGRAHDDKIENTSVYANLWTSELDTVDSIPDTAYYFSYENGRDLQILTDERFNGFQIRGVFTPQN